MAFAHTNFDNEVLHLDLKPQNIFLKSEDQIKLGDFGACMDIGMEKKYLMEESDGKMKSSHYMAPELYKDPPQASSKCDIWSLGCIMYELIALKGPFEDSSYATLAQKICEEKPLPLPECINEKLKDLIWHMIDKDPSKRPSALEILQIIEE